MIDTDTDFVTTTTTIDLDALAEALWVLRERIDDAPQRHTNTILAELADRESDAIMDAWHVVTRLARYEKYPSLHSADDDYFQDPEPSPEPQSLRA